MRVTFYASEKERETKLAEALREGAARHGDELRILSGQGATHDGVACMFGVKSADRLHACWQNGQETILFDKGYTRDGRYIRAAVNAIQPIRSFQVGRKPDRWSKVGARLHPRRRGRSIIFAGSSEKFHRAAGLAHPTIYASQVIEELRARTGRPIIYRPKPSWRHAIPIEGSEMRREGPLSALLADAHALVTWGSSAAVEAIVSGVPVVALGDTIARPVSETNLDRIAMPYFPSDDRRLQWCSDLAYCQWTLDEYASGEAWGHIRAQLCSA